MGSSFGTGGMQTKLIAAELATAAGVATVILNGSEPSNMVRIVEKGLPAQSLADGGDSLASSVASLTAEEASMIGHPPLSDPAHTLFLPKPNPLSSRKWSILHALHPAGTLIIDEGAFRRIARADSGGRLLPAGVVGVEGNWERMQAVRLVVRRSKTAPSSSDNAQGSEDWQHIEVGRGLANYTSIESERIKGIKRYVYTFFSLSPSFCECDTALTHATHHSSQITSVLGYADSDYLTDQVALHTTTLP